MGRFGADRLDPMGVGSNGALIARYESTGHPEKALALREDHLARMSAKLGVQDPKLLVNVKDLIKAYIAQGKPEKAEALADQHAGFDPQKDAPDSPRQAQAMLWLAEARRDVGKPSEAEPLLRRAVAILEAKEPGSRTTFDAQSLLGESLLHQGKYAEAEPLLWAGYEGFRKAGDEYEWNRMDVFHRALDRLLLLADWTNKPPGPAGRSLPLLEHYLERTRLAMGPYRPEHPYVLGALRRLAGAYVAFGQDDKAKALVRDQASRYPGGAAPGPSRPPTPPPGWARRTWRVVDGRRPRPLCETP